MGTGSMARYFMEDFKYLPQAQMIAAGSRKPETAREFSKKYDIPHVHGSYPDLVQDPEETGREEIDGVGVVRIEGTIDEERARAGIGDALDAVGVSGADVPLGDGRVAVLVGVEDLLPRRVEVAVGDVSGEDPAVDLALSPSDFGADLEVVAPDDPQPLGSSGLGGLLGG